MSEARANFRRRWRARRRLKERYIAMINISISDEAIKLFKAKSENLKELIRKRAVAKLADEIYQNAFNRADEHTQTGVLLSALYNRKKSDLRYEVGIDNKRASYGIFVHNGTKAHEIKPKNRKFLRWVVGSEFVFAKKVKHPGFQGDPFFELAVRDEVPKFERWLEREIKRV